MIFEPINFLIIFTPRNSTLRDSKAPVLFFPPQDQDIYESKTIHSFMVYEVRNSACGEIAEWTRGRYAKVETSGTGSSGQSGRANIASAKG